MNTSPAIVSNPQDKRICPYAPTQNENSFFECSEPLDEWDPHEFSRLTKTASLPVRETRFSEIQKTKKGNTGDDVALGTMVLGSGFLIGGPVGLAAGALLLTRCYGVEGIGIAKAVEVGGVGSGPALAWTGSEYGLSWVDTRDGDRATYFTKLNENGEKILDDERVAIANGSSFSSYPFLAWTGSEFGIGYLNARIDHNSYAYLARLEENGRIITNDVDLSNKHGEGDAVENLTLAWNESRGEYGISWNRGGGIDFLRLDQNGNPLTAVGKVTMGGLDRNSSLVAAGNVYGLSWFEDTWPNAKVYFGQMNTENNQMDVAVRVTNDNFSSVPILVWNNEDQKFGISWVDDKGTPHGSAFRGDVFFALIDQSGRKGNELQLTAGTANQTRSPLVWTGSEYGLSWVNNTNDLFLARINREGNEIIQKIQVTNTSSVAFDQPSLVWTGTAYGLVWTESREAYGPLQHGAIYFTRIIPVAQN